MMPCPQKGSHNNKVCMYYHKDIDRRRTNQLYYSSDLCKNN